MLPIGALASSLFGGASKVIGSGLLGKGLGGMLGSGSANPLASFFGGLQNLSGSLLGNRGEAQSLSSMNTQQQGGLLGIVNRLVSVLENVISGLMSKLTGNTNAVSTNPGTASNSSPVTSNLLQTSNSQQ